MIAKDFEHAGEKRTVTVEPLGEERYRVRIGDVEHDVAAHRTPDGGVALRIDGRPFRGVVARAGDRGELMVRVAGRTHRLRPWIGAAASAGAGTGVLEAPMTGTLLAVHVAVGDTVKIGQTLALLTAMKMEHKLVADVDGTVVEVGAAAGDSVAQGDVVVRVEPSEA